MKKKYVLLLILLSVFGVVATAQATLLEVGDGVVYDEVSDLYWYQDLTAFASRTYDEQILDIPDLTVADSNPNDVYSWGSWRMAENDEIIGLNGYLPQIIGGVFVKTYTDTTTGMEDWCARYVHIGSVGDPPVNTNNVGAYRVYHYPDGGWVTDIVEASPQSASAYMGAWVVSSTPAVPEPTTLMLLCTGLVGLAFFRARKKRTHNTS
ncbi:MAG: PEP-CTERM sorting domain-containing protein [Desulfobacterales bacterium]|nr:PEP-CTERM sorting domain-containing protein [Desulfobacterales bacterium]